MRPERKLTPAEAALWARVARTVMPMSPARGGGRAPAPSEALAEVPAPAPATAKSTGREAPTPAPRRAAPPPPPPPPPRPADERRPLGPHGLDAGWDRKLARGVVSPDFTLDLHGATLDAAYSRLEHGLALALAQGARVVLLITGRDRPSEDRRSRGAIRRKFMDWLTAGPHASRVAAVRPAHPRHGGAGAVYIVLRRPR